MNKLNDVINDYFNDIKRCKALFKEKFGEDLPLSLWRGKKIPRESTLKDEIKYSFHGIGCYIELENYGIDFDKNFDPVFDYYKLKDYIEGKNEYLKNKYYNLNNYDNELNKILQDGVVEKISGALYKKA